jgi:hypothetical protein
MQQRQRPEPRRRSAKEWCQLLDEHRQSGIDLDLFAQRKGVPAARLRWWKWKLGMTGDRGAAPPQGLRLLPVDLSAPAVSSPAGVTLEFQSADGHQLRLFGPLDVELVRQVCLAMMGSP